MSRRMSNLTRIRIMKRQAEKLKEEKRTLREENRELRETNKRKGELNKSLLEKLRRRDELLRVAQTTIDRYRADRPAYPCVKKPSMPPLADKYPSAIVVSGD